MKFRTRISFVTFLCFTAAAMTLVGCGGAERKGGQAKDKSKEKRTEVAQTKGHDVGGWWCGEHGVPEAECSMCSAKAAAEFKKKGDWCEEHDRAKSQCFICDPKLKEKYAAIYRAKEGKDPPLIEEEEPKAKTKQDKKG